MARKTALESIENGLQPRRRIAQTYGKRKPGVAKFQQLRQDIFGHSGSDIENEFTKLTIAPPKSDDTTPHRSRTIEPQREDFLRKEGTNHQDESPKCLPTATVKSETDGVLFEKLLDLSSSDGIEDFTTFGNKISKLFSIAKVGEGSFAEVFKIEVTSLTSTTSESRNQPLFSSNFLLSSQEHTRDLVQGSYTSIIKVIPLLSPHTRSGIRDRCSAIDSVSHEVNILKQLDPIHGFTRFRGIRLVKGKWPVSFLTAYRDFRKKHRKRAINAPPDQDFDDQQVYALVEMDDAGLEIGLLKKPSVFQTWDIFWSSVILLANAEETIEFEHRDLHMSNICVRSSRSSQQKLSVAEAQNNLQTNNSNASIPARLKSTDQARSDMDISPDLLLTMNEIPEHLIGLSDLRVTLIDYTVARARLEPVEQEESPSRRIKSKCIPSDRVDNNGIHNDDNIIFDPMRFTSDPFSSDDDIENHIQNLTYQKTRAIATLREITQAREHNDTSRHTISLESANKWRAFMPRTNVVWLGYLLRVLIHRARGRTGKLHLLKGQPGKHGNDKMIKQLQEQMWSTMIEMSKLLNGSNYREFENDEPKTPRAKKGTSGRSDDTESTEPIWTDQELFDLPASSLEIIELAVQADWLSTEDIQAFRSKLEDENS